MIPPDYELKFVMDLFNSNVLIEGLLFLIKDGKEINSFKATSGVPGCQSVNFCNQPRRGPIPPLNYMVDTEPVALYNVKGVEGNFFIIRPTKITYMGVSRGDFGVHYDANVPGSAGCLVLRTRLGWEAYQREMDKIEKKGIRRIPLSIFYT